MPAMPPKTRSKSCVMDRSDGNSAMQSLGVHSRRLNEGIKKLQELNINTALSSLPKYAAVGDQSAGKSSIVQALCGISLPRSSGTTTRCPFLITTRKETSSQETWTCEVSIKKQDYCEDDRGRQYDGFQSQVTRFATITDIAELEDTLRRAQIAILNPQEDPTRYATVDLTEHTTTAALFSKDIICLDISAPNLPELMFYDLPGCIKVYDMPKSVLSGLKQQQDEERDLIDMITSTVTSYIRDEKCLLLLACSADQDVEMSLTMKYIRHHSAEDRCTNLDRWLARRPLGSFGVFPMDSGPSDDRLKRTLRYGTTTGDVNMYRSPTDEQSLAVIRCWHRFQRFVSQAPPSATSFMSSANQRTGVSRRYPGTQARPSEISKSTESLFFEDGTLKITYGVTPSLIGLIARITSIAQASKYYSIHNIDSPPGFQTAFEQLTDTIDSLPTLHATAEMLSGCEESVQTLLKDHIEAFALDIEIYCFVSVRTCSREQMDELVQEVGRKLNDLEQQKQ